MNDNDAWDWGLGRWEVYFGLVLVSTVVYVLADGGSWHATAVAVALLTALLPWYALVGRRAIGTDQDSLATYVYIAGLILLCSSASAAAPESSLVLFAACPQCFMMMRWSRSIVAVTLINGVPAVRFLLHTSDVASVVTFLVWSVVVITFSGYFGFWIDRIIAQSIERRELIQRLEATQAELSEVSREAGVMAERERMAAEIHDTLAQGFTSILMLLQAAEPHIGRDPESARRQVGLAVRTARENLAEARALVAAVPPAALGDSSLDEAVRRLSDRLGEEAGLDTDCTVSGDPRRLPARTEVVLLRAAQEGLANVRRHAKAGHVAIGLRYEAAMVRLEIADDGRGFDPAAANGFGLRGMRERAAQVDGTLKVRSTPGEGTSITVEVPVS